MKNVVIILLQHKSEYDNKIKTLDYLYEWNCEQCWRSWWVPQVWQCWRCRCRHPLLRRNQRVDDIILRALGEWPPAPGWSFAAAGTCRKVTVTTPPLARFPAAGSSGTSAPPATLSLEGAWSVCAAFLPTGATLFWKIKRSIKKQSKKIIYLLNNHSVKFSLKKSLEYYVNKEQ